MRQRLFNGGKKCASSQKLSYHFSESESALPEESENAMPGNILSCGVVKDQEAKER